MTDESTSERSKTTLTMTPVPQWAIELGKSTSHLSERVAQLTNVVNDISARIVAMETGTEAQPGVIRRLIASDSKQDTELETERKAREALAEKVDCMLKILERLGILIENPKAKILAGMLLTAMMTWLASKGMALQ